MVPCRSPLTKGGLRGGDRRAKAAAQGMTEYFNKTTEKEKRRFLRRNMPEAEKLIWSRLRRGQMMGHGFRRQYSVSAYVVDFYCPALTLAVEIDGDSHFGEETCSDDKVRRAFIESFGFRFLRFTKTMTCIGTWTVF